MSSSALEFPSDPQPDQTYTLSNNIVYVWDGLKFTSLGATVISDENNAIIGAAAPANVAQGSFWYDTTSERLKVLIGGTWKDVRPSS